MFRSRKWCSLMRQGFFFIVLFLKVLPAAAHPCPAQQVTLALLDSEGSRWRGYIVCPLPKGLEVREKESFLLLPSPCATTLWPDSVNFPLFTSGAQYGEGKGFLILSFSSSGHNYSVITQQITTLPFLLGRGVRLDAPTFYYPLLIPPAGKRSTVKSGFWQMPI